MISELPIPTILSIGKLCQPLANVANQKNTLFGSSTLDPRLGRTIYEVQKPLSLRYAANPNDPTVRQVAEYLLSLCGPYALTARQIINNLTQSPPIITGPSNQSVLVGSTATFSVSVTGTAPFSYQWFLNGVVIPGAINSSYSKTNCQLTDTGGQYSVQVTNITGIPVFSNPATLTVTASIIGYWYAGGTDYSVELEANTDTVAYSGTLTITDGQPIVAPLPAGQSDYIVIKYPVSQSVKTHYANPASGIDQGPVPGLALNTNTFGGNNYIFSRTGNLFGINNGSGQVTFS